MWKLRLLANNKIIDRWVFSKRSISGEYSATKGKQNDEIGIQSYIMSMAPFAIKYIEFFYRQFGTLALMHAIFVHECHELVAK